MHRDGYVTRSGTKQYIVCDELLGNRCVHLINVGERNEQSNANCTHSMLAASKWSVFPYLYLRYCGVCRLLAYETCEQIHSLDADVCGKYMMTAMS